MKNLIIFIFFYILLIFYLFLGISPVNNWNFIIMDRFKLKRNKRETYDKYEDKDGDVIYGLETSKLDVIIIDIDRATPFWKLYEMFYKDMLKGNKYVVETINGGLHFYYSYSKSRRKGLDNIFRKCHISCGGLIGLDVLVSDTYGIIPPSKFSYGDKVLGYRWRKDILDFRDVSVLEGVPEGMIGLLNYLGKSEYNYNFYNKYNGLNYGDIYRFKRENVGKTKLVIFWSDGIKDYMKERLIEYKDIYFGEKRLGSYVREGDNIFFLSDFHFKLLPSKLFDKYVIHLFNVFKVDIYISIQTGGTKNKMELGCIRQSDNIYIFDDKNIKKLSYQIDNDYEFAPLVPLAYVGKFSDIPKEPLNGVITSDAAFSLFSCASSSRPVCKAYCLSILTDYVFDKNFGAMYKETRHLYGKFLDKFLLKII